MSIRKTASTTAVALAAGLIALPASAQTLNVVTAGSENMVDYVNDYLGPLFEKQNPGVTVRVVGTGPGAAGSQKIFEKLDAQAKAGTEEWDIDVAVVHQKMAGDMREADLLGNYRGDIETGDLVTRDTAKSALGVDVDGYVMPMFHSQTAIAYNPDIVGEPPDSYDELQEWVAANPGQFGYNGIKQGMSGVSFVVGWMYAYTGQEDQLANGPYDAALKDDWSGVLGDLKTFNEGVTFTPGNAGTLDMLNRGEIVMGPVWVDMFYTWQADGRVAPNIKLNLIGPGMPGQPMYYITPSKAANPDLARKFIELATSPEIQAEGIVKRFNWYPGIDAEHVEDSLEPADFDALFADVSPEDLATKGKVFPIGPFFDDILESYEKEVQN
ncbi:MAG: extracellular solute-binding protein [Hyphomicrobiales bacterium]|nr:extracellular solute-binding protein [Hyphomicrobiales bacterium]